VIRVGVDVGGTFTDVTVLDERLGRIEVLKLPSTPDSPERAVHEGIGRIRAARRVSSFVHGTTIATNALLEGKAPPVALLVTAGFRDVLEIARQERPHMYDLFSRRPEPLAPRYLRLEVPERMTYLGTPSLALDEARVREIARELVDAGVRSVAVCFLHSYANPAHEHAVRRIFGEEAPELDLTLSSDVVREFKEYERMSTAVVNAYVKPPVRRYLEQLRVALRDQGIDALHVMQSNGGMMNVDAACEQPVQTILSGPAAGALAGAETARLAGFEDAISIDMGGTSFDVSIAVGGSLVFTTEGEIAARAIKVPLIDIHTLGAGGGSIAWIDRGGGLQVGPESAGAVPGPACYGVGGVLPTVTDANVVLGRCDARGLLAGALHVDESAAREAVRRIAEPLRLTIERAAAGIVDVVNAAMVHGMRYVSVERGNDPREFVLVAFGGCGPAHAVDLANALDMRVVLIPLHPGLHSAFGLLRADHRRDFVATMIQALDGVDPERLGHVLEGLVEDAVEVFAADGVPAESVTLLPLAEARYVGQGAVLSVPFRRPVDASTPGDVVRAFHALHRRQYGFDQPGEAVEVVNLRVVATAPVEKPALVEEELDGPDSSAAEIGTRRVFFDGVALLTALYERELLRPGNKLDGPAVVHQVDSTTVVPPGHVLKVDPYRNLMITREQRR
jgi:N-methylhydantoinase A